MRFAWVILWLPMAAIGVVDTSPPVREAESAAPQHPDKRRAALRSALKPAPGTDPIELAPAQMPMPMPVRRQLSEQERADLRQQLRQQSRPGSPQEHRAGMSN